MQPRARAAQRRLAAAYNAGIRAADADYYMLLAAGCLVAPGMISTLLAELRAHPNVGLAGPRLEAADGSPLVSCFRRHTLIGEFLAATRLRRVHALLRRFELQLPPSDEPLEADWLSFTCVLMRREVVERVGLLDEAYVRYFEDSDDCRAAARIRLPHPLLSERPSGPRRPAALEPEHTPRTFYASRARYFRKGYGAARSLARQPIRSSAASSRSATAHTDGVRLELLGQAQCVRADRVRPPELWYSRASAREARDPAPLSRSCGCRGRAFDFPIVPPLTQFAIAALCALIGRTGKRARGCGRRASGARRDWL